MHRIEVQGVIAPVAGLMMPSVHRTATLFLALAAASLPAQQQAPEAPIDKGLLTVNVVVTPGSKGAPIAGLSQNSFTVLDNGALQPIRSFRAVPPIGCRPALQRLANA